MSICRAKGLIKHPYVVL